MVIVAISHGINCDKPFTTTYKVNSAGTPPMGILQLLAFLDQQPNVESSHIDELIVIDDDSVQARYTSDEINEVFEDVDDDEFEECIDNVA